MRLELPKSNTPAAERDLVDALDRELGPAELEMNVSLVTWKVVDAYLAGIRKFRVTDRWAGNISIAWENAKGELDMRYEEITRQYLTEVGRYMKMDISPVAGKRGESLDSLRKAAIGNATLGSLASKMNMSTLKRSILIPFLKYGTVGVNHYETGDADMPDLIEVVPARQLRGLPAFVDGTYNLYGISRVRWVPMDWLVARMKSVYGKKLKEDPYAQLRAQDIPWGSTPPGQTTYEMGGLAPAGAGFAGTGDLGMKRSDLLGTQISDPQQEGARARRFGRPYVQLEEIYIYDDSQQFVSRYVVKAGDVIIVDENFEDKRIKVLCPLHVARHTDIGKMFARGFVAPMIPFNDQIEKMFASLFKNIAEMDMFGTLFVHGASGIDIKRWRTGPRPKAEKYEPDPMNPGGQPFQLTPQNSGTMPAKVAQLALDQMQSLAGQGPAFQGETSGRIDSAAGLGFLFNTGNIALGLPTHGVADALAGAYARMLQVAKDRLGPGDTVELATIDDAIAGVIIDPTTGDMELESNPIPEAWEVDVNIKDRVPRDREIRKQELQELVQQGLVDPTRFWVAALEENLDFPGADREIWETWRKATWQIIVMFRDGKEPGPLVIGEHTQNPDIQLMAVQQFMNKIEFSLASEEVRNAFISWKVRLEILAGKNFPMGLGPPEEIAQEAMAGLGAEQRGEVPQLGIPTGVAPGVQAQ
jgi:hypothetical protein